MINDNGGTKNSDDFTFELNGGLSTSFESDGQNDLSVTPNTTYNVTEPTVAGYATTYSGCSNISIAVGGSSTCTITNDDIAPSLQLIKSMIYNSLGNALASDWTLTASGPTTISGAAGVVSGATFSAGTYSLSESTGPSGYLASEWNCIKNDESAVLGSSITLGLGDNATCTITNSDLPGYLTVIKNVIGGTKSSTDFSFSVNGGTSVAFKSNGNVLTVSRGTYTVTESTDTDYLDTYSGCENVYIHNGGSATCTITNTRKTGRLFIDKLLSGTGSALPSDWSFVVKTLGGSVLGTLYDNGTDDNISLDTGSYTITESNNVPGYSLTSVSGACLTRDGLIADVAVKSAS